MLVRILILAVSVVGIQSATCPRDWFLADGSCWSISHQKASWGAAQADCSAFHGDLAVVLDNQILNTLEVALTSTHATGDKFWLGGTDMFREGDWLWAPTEQQIDFSPFGFSHPSDNDKDKNCIYLEKGHRTWKADDCQEENYFICQHKPSVNGGAVIG